MEELLKGKDDLLKAQDEQKSCLTSLQESSEKSSELSVRVVNLIKEKE
eukprot:CAMPEP_0184483634 /NCGR_PEP_ID=MMETSP0113_2-20130426/5314_1 /TAXON_ID=91329 /ORGANISM="Norrisiella sphaerica, Strain BC52" /LENGTH=47 /DNA_ID= /DNA_START= /DNA_END= /DNA_ORIENTATION=